MSVEREFNITIKLSKDLVERLELMVELDQLNYEELIVRALHHYVTERQNLVLRELLQRGYQEMAEINLDLACMCFEVEEEADLTLVEIVKGV